jgi:hypothetical protein
MIGTVLLALPGVFCLLLVMAQPIFFGPPGDHQLMFGTRLSGHILFTSHLMCFASPLTTLAAIAVTLWQFFRVAAYKRWVMLVVCGVAIVGVIRFWGTLLMIGDRF